MGGLAIAEMNGQLGPHGGGGGGGDYYGGGGGGGDYYGDGGRSKRPRVDWDARDRR